MAISQIPVKFIFHSYSDSSTFGTPVLGRCNLPHQMANSQIPALLWKLIYGRLSVGRSTPPIIWQFHRFLLWQLIFHSYSDSSTFGRPGLRRSTPLIKGNFTDSSSTLRVHIWQTKCWQMYPLSNGNFADFCSDSSYFIPTLRAHHLADQVLTDLPPIQWWFYRFLPWQLSTLRAYHLADQVLADLPPHQTAISQISALLWELIFSRPPSQMVISQIPALTAH